MIKKQPVSGAKVIALSEHVDYWNRLGWRDPFSSSSFTDRQNDYARSLRLNSLYTPQMIVDGKTEFVGSDASRAISAVASAAKTPKIPVSVMKSDSSKPGVLALTIRIEPKKPFTETAEVMFAVTENNLVSNVSSGENSGRKLEHFAVVRKLQRIGEIDGKVTKSLAYNISPDKAWKPKDTGYVVFVQGKSSRKVYGIGALDAK